MNRSLSIEILKNRLAWECTTIDPDTLHKTPNTLYFNIDNELVYFPFHLDFGPLNLGLVYRYCKKLETLLADPAHQKKKIIHYTSSDPYKRTNAACLMCCFCVIILGKTSDSVWNLFSPIHHLLIPYRDASNGNCTYQCTVYDCIGGLEYAMSLGWFNYKLFDLQDYEHYEKIQHGDMNWIIPNKFVAFSGPSAVSQYFANGRTYTPSDYVPIFHQKKVSLVVRLNNKQYDSSIFTKNGIDHLELFFPDGSCPADHVIKTFLNTVDKHFAEKKEAIAVHCKAGLGRTGTLIGLYAMRTYRFPAAKFIGFIRLVRPGSILGPQQQFLIEKEKEYFLEYSKIERMLWEKSVVPSTMDETEEENLHRHSIASPMNETSSFGSYTPRESEFAVQFRDFGQGERLVAARMHQKLNPSGGRKTLPPSFQRGN